MGILDIWNAALTNPRDDEYSSTKSSKLNFEKGSFSEVLSSQKV